MYKRGLIAVKQQKMSHQKKKGKEKKTKGNRTFDRQTFLFVCFSRVWGGVGKRSLVLVVAYYWVLPPPPPPLRPFSLSAYAHPIDRIFTLLDLPLLSMWNMATTGYLFTHWPQKFTLRLPMLWWLKAMLESEKKTVLPFYRRNKNSPFWKPVNSRISMNGLRWSVSVAIRVLIVDWDIHHGNGTQHLFESDPRYV